jgi:WD40 repeat protein
MALAKGKFRLLLLLAVPLPVGLVAFGHQPNDQKQLTNVESQKKQPSLDLHGDPLPEGALARLGTMRMRHAHPISGAVFSRDGKSILASDFYSGVHVWDVAEGKEVRRFFTNDWYCHRLALSPDGRTLAVALGDLSVRLCDPRSGHEFGSLPRQEDRVCNLVFSPDSSLLATGTGRKSIRIWDVAARRLIRKLTFSENVGEVSFSSDGKLIACGTTPGVCLWDLAQGKEVRQLKNDPDGRHSLRVIFAPKGGPLAVWGYEDASIRLFDANGGKEIRRFNKEGDTKTTDPWGWSYLISVNFSPNGKILATSRDAGRIDLWDVESGKKLHTLTFKSFHQAVFLAFSPDGTKLASAGGDPWVRDTTIRLWDVTKGKEVLPLVGHSSPIPSVAISPNGAIVATAGQDGIIYLWDRSSGKHLFRLEGHPDRHPQVSFSRDGQRMIWWETYNRYGTLRIWDSRTGQAVSRLKLQGRDAYWKAVSDNGKMALSFDEKGKSFRFHDLATGKITHEVANAANIPPIALSPANDKTVCSDGTLRNAADRKELLHLGWRNRGVSFSADGRRLVAAVMSKATAKLPLGDPPTEEIAVIDPIEGKELRRFGMQVGKFHAIDTVALSRDGKMVVTVGHSRDEAEAEIKLWETETGRERGHYVGHRGRARSVAISADGRFVVSGGENTSALVWDATRPRTRNAFIRRESTATDLVAHFKNLAGDNAEQAYASMWALQSAPKKTISFLGDQNSLFTSANVRAIQRWIRDLDSDKFAERERAAHELGWILDEAESHLKKALQGKPSLEVRRRIDQLLEERSRGPIGKELQRFRVIEILEHIAAPGADAAEGADATRRAAIALLKKLAAGAAEVRPTQEAKASLERLERRADRNP